METVLCPECKTGTLSIESAQTEQTIHPGYHVKGTPLPTRLRNCTIAACNACEFCYELTATGLVGYKG